MDFLELGEAIRRARKQRALSQGQLAATLAMSRATISAIENGTITEIGVRKLVALCGALGLRLSVSEESRRPTLEELREEQRVYRAAAMQSRSRLIPTMTAEVTRGSRRPPNSDNEAP
jgi:HTH-type transcriptional regulator / antitoxin HipB